MEPITIKIVRSDDVYRKIMEAPLERKDDIYRYELMKPFEQKFAMYHCPLKAKQPGGYDVVMASGMLGYLVPQKIDVSTEESIALLEEDTFWENCKKSIEKSLKCFTDTGIELPVKEYVFSTLLADPESPYSIMNDNYCGDGGIPGYILGSLVPSQYTMSRLPVAMAHETNHNVKIHTLQGEDYMNDNEKFEGFKQKLIGENEKIYGEEIHRKYGSDLLEASNAKVKAMSQGKWQEVQALEEQIRSKLKEAFEQGNPAGELAKEVCDLHRQWLCTFWKDGTYSKQAHKELAEGYVVDERFTEYYDKIAVGCTKFLRDAIVAYCGENETC